MEDENALIPEEPQRPPTTPVSPVKKKSKWGAGCLLIIPLFCFMIALSLALVSMGISAYLTWNMAGLEIALAASEPNAVQAKLNAVTPTAPLQIAIISEALISPTPSPAQPGGDIPQPPTATPTITWIDTKLPELQNAGAVGASEAASPEPGATLSSNNTYRLIPIEGERDPRPAAEHGDLNIKLRNPQPNDAEAKLIDYTGYTSPDAPKLSAVFEQNFVRTYTVHEWDWDCNCQGALKNDGYLLGIKTTPGEPVYIPARKQDIYQGKYRALLLYAAEDTVTFIYNREDSVERGYVIHYLGLQTDPNLLAVYKQSASAELPGLTLDTPVGIASDELIVSIRSKGAFMDVRSRKDWWD